MSEYTQYFILKSSLELEVKQKLNKAKIISVIDSDKERFGFTEKYNNTDGLDWIIVSAPADSGFVYKESFKPEDELIEKGSKGSNQMIEELSKHKEFYCKNKFEDICKIFKIVIFFFEEENASDWSMHVKYDSGILFKKFYAGKNALFTEEEKHAMEQVFEKDFSSLQPFLAPGKSNDFLNFNGISYQHMNNQDLIELDSVDGKYSFLVSEL